jgi:hypothetical protein
MCLRLVYNIVVYVVADIKRMRRSYAVRKFNSSFPEMVKIWLHHVDVFAGCRIMMQNCVNLRLDKQYTKSSVREASMDIIPVISTWNKLQYVVRFKEGKSSAPAQL